MKIWMCFTDAADLLLEKEKISREEFEALFDEEGTKKED